MLISVLSSHDNMTMIEKLLSDGTAPQDTEVEIWKKSNKFFRNYLKTDFLSTTQDTTEDIPHSGKRLE